MLEGARGTAIVWAVAAVLATLAAVRLLAGDKSPSAPPVRLDDGAVAGGQPGGAERGVGNRREGVFVHVAGAVRRPGLYRLDAAARVAQALQRAGGPLRRAELTAVNLAARVADGQQVVVPIAGRPGVAGAAPGAAGAGVASGGGASGAGAAAGVKLSLASATPEQLEELDGIGPTLAQRIIEYRDAQGGLTALDQLDEVDGIGEKRLAALREELQP